MSILVVRSDRKVVIVIIVAAIGLPVVFMAGGYGFNRADVNHVGCR